MVQQYFFNGQWYVAIPVQLLPPVRQSPDNSGVEVGDLSVKDTDGLVTADIEASTLSWASLWYWKNRPSGRPALVIELTSEESSK